MRRGYCTCSQCGKELKVADAVVHASKKYCHQCAIELDINTSETDYDDLVQYLQNLCSNDKDTMGFLLMQVKRLVNMKECRYTYAGILRTLRYIFETINDSNSFDLAYGIEHLVITYYTSASAFEKLRARTCAQDVDEIAEILTKPAIELYADNTACRDKRKEFLLKLREKEYGKPFDLNDIPDDDFEEVIIDGE